MVNGASQLLGPYPEQTRWLGGVETGFETQDGFKVPVAA